MAATETLYLHSGGDLAKCTAWVAAHIRQRGVRAKQITKFREKTIFHQHEKAVAAAHKCAWIGGDQPLAWASEAPNTEQNIARHGRADATALRQRHYESLWPHAERHCFGLIAQGIDERAAAELAAAFILNFEIHGSPGGRSDLGDKIVASQSVERSTTSIFSPCGSPMIFGPTCNSISPAAATRS